MNDSERKLFVKTLCALETVKTHLEFVLKFDTDGRLKPGQANTLRDLFMQELLPYIPEEK